jgi:molybdopterin-binding protein
MRRSESAVLGERSALVPTSSVLRQARVMLRALDAGRRPWVPISARNQIKGTVTSITRGEATANVVIDASGLRLVSSITVEAADELELREGVAVTAIVKASDVIVSTD